MTRVGIDRIAAGGDGVGRLADGLTVFVPRAAPGDVLEVDLVARKPRFARARIRAVLEPGPDRVSPGCPHYERDHCGGCQLQHLGYPAQLAAKRGIVRDALKRLGGREVPEPPITPSPQPWRYRTRLTLAAGRATNGDAPALGFHVEGAPGAVFQLDDCRIAGAPLMAAWRGVRAHRALLPPDLEGLVIRTDRAGGLHLVVLGGSPWDADTLANVLQSTVASVWWRPAGGAARVLAGGREAFPALAFEQVNPPAADALRAQAIEHLGDVRGQVVWDLYGGVGDTARALAAGGAQVAGVDADRSATDWARSQPTPGPGAATYLAARVEDVLRQLPAPDAVIVNPPRTGLHGRVADHLDRWARGRPGARVCYLSCDPATLARDLRRMPSLGLERLEASDHFPQTAHVECLAVLVAP